MYCSKYVCIALGMFYTLGQVCFTVKHCWFVRVIALL